MYGENIQNVQKVGKTNYRHTSPALTVILFYLIFFVFTCIQAWFPFSSVAAHLKSNQFKPRVIQGLVGRLWSCQREVPTTGYLHLLSEGRIRSTRDEKQI